MCHFFLASFWVMLLNKEVEQTKRSKQTMNYIYNTGAFAGRVSEEGATILDVPFHQLDEDLQRRIVESWELRNNETIDVNDLAVLEGAKECYEFSWASEETDKPVDLTPVSTWS